MSESATPPSQIEDIIHESRISPAQWAIIAICILAYLLDGFDIAVIAFTAPAISEEWSIASQQLGLVFSAGFVGMTVGAMFLAPLADIYGRRVMVSLMLLLSGVTTIGVAFTSTVPELIVMRMLAGLGLGALVAILPPLIGEFCPKRHRTLILSIAFSGVSVGPVIGGLISAPIIAEHGWRVIFLSAGILTLFAGVMMYVVVPESIAFIIKRKPDQALGKVNNTLRYLGQKPIHQLPPVGTAGTQESASVASLLVPARRRITLITWATFLFGFMAVYFLVSWVPQILANAGFSQEQAIRGGVVATSGSILGTIMYGWLARWRALNRMLAAVFAVGAIGMLSVSYLLGSDSPSLWLIWVTLFLVGTTLMGGFTNLYTVALTIYPVQIRSTALGWAAGVGRCGAVISPVLAGMLIGAGLSMPTLFIYFTIPALIAAAGVLLLKMQELP